MHSSLVACVVAVCTLLVLDAVWLSVGGAGSAFFSTAAGIGTIQPWKGWQTAIFAFAAYALLSTAVCSTVLMDKDPARAAARGALVGFVIYGVFDFTNLAIFGRGYGMDLAFSDLAWGTFLIGTSSLMGSLAGVNMQAKA
jgi:uncharacterized membrane protein